MTRSRGMFAASLLVVAVLASYVSLAVLSLSVAHGPLPIPVPGFVSTLAGKVFYQPPTLPTSVHAKTRTAVPVAGVVAADFNFPAFTEGSHQASFDVGNPLSTPLTVSLGLTTSRPGVSARFSGGGSKATILPHRHATVTVVSDPLVAGPVTGTLTISSPNFAAKSWTFTADQAPVVPGAVTATAAAGGTVNLSWAPSPSTGVAGYLVERLGASGTWTAVGGPVAGTSMVDQTPADGSYRYRVSAQAVGGGSVASGPSVSPAVVSDSTAPDAPGQVAFGVKAVNADTPTPLHVTVELPPTSQATDTITVTLTDGTQSVVQTAPGGQASVDVAFGLKTLADGKLTATATATDAVGNVSPGTQSQTIVMDTVAPDAVTVQSPITLITPDNAAEVPFTVNADAADAGDTVVVTVASGSQSAASDPATIPAGGGDVPVTVDASSLTPDGPVTVSAVVTDGVGNTTSMPGPTNMTLDLSGPAKPAFWGVAMGDQNPAKYVNAASQTAVTIRGTFAEPLQQGETISIAIVGADYTLPVSFTPGDTTFSVGPVDLSGLADGDHMLKMTLVDQNGVSQNSWRGFTKDTVAPDAPASVGVPAGPDNPAGYVNAATQAAATIVADFSAPTDSGDQVSLSIGGLSLGSQAGGNSDVTWSPADLTSLPDGTLPIDGTITDAAGNSTSFSDQLIKDTQAPPAPVAAHVLGPPADTITPGGASCVQVGVQFNQAPDPSDTVTVTLSDHESSVQGSASAGDGQVTVGCIDATSLDARTIAVTVTVTDAAGNSVAVDGTPATKLPSQPN